MFPGKFFQKVSASVRSLNSFVFLTLIIFYIVGCDFKNNAVNSQPTFTLVLDSKTPNFEAEETPTFQVITATLFPTLVFEERKRNLIKLFSTDGDCSTPCWWGVRQGDSIEKVKELQRVLGEPPLLEKSSMYSYTVSLEKINTPDVYTQFFFDNNQFVNQIDVFLEKPPRFKDYFDVFENNLSLSVMLNKYGKPDDVLLLITPRIEKDMPIGYELALVYKNDGFIVQYIGIIDFENPIKICSLEITDFHLQMFEMHFAEAAIVEGNAKKLLTVGYRPIDEATSLSKDDFFLLFSEPENAKCIEPLDSQ